MELLLPRTSENIDILSAAMVNAQSQFPTIGKNKKGGGGRYNYADITEIVEEIKPILFKNQLSVWQPPAVNITAHALIICTRIIHSSGQWIESYYPVPTPLAEELRGGMTTIQGQGSNLSYSKRYALASMLGIVTADEDTDGAYTSENRSNTGTISEKQVNLLKYKLKNNQALEQKIITRYQSLAAIPREQFDAILKLCEE